MSNSWSTDCRDTSFPNREISVRWFVHVTHVLGEIGEIRRGGYTNGKAVKKWCKGLRLLKRVRYFEFSKGYCPRDTPQRNRRESKWIKIVHFGSDSDCINIAITWGGKPAIGKEESIVYWKILNTLAACIRIIVLKISLNQAVSLCLTNPITLYSIVLESCSNPQKTRKCKKNFWFCVSFFCDWRHRLGRFSAILAHVTWPRAQPLGGSNSFKFSLKPV